jgi:hypothetical protein
MSNDIALSIADHVATVEINRPPNNFFDYDLIREIGEFPEQGVLGAGTAGRPGAAALRGSRAGIQRA